MMLIHLFLSIVFSHSQEFTFTALGDTGMDNSGQARVAESLKSICEKEECELNLMLGDILYPTGPSSSNDPQFYHKFEKHYQDIPIPFLISMGNHDYGKNEDFSKGLYYLEYAQTKPQFLFPDYFYSYEIKNTLFLILDTVRIIEGLSLKAQKEMIDEAISSSKAKWLVAIGHHPYLSNGSHGNAGRYNGIPFPPKFSGARFKKFFEENICGKVDLYLAGHDHNQQFLVRKEGCQTHLVVSGAGAGSNDEIKEKNPFHFITTDLGFTLLKAFNDRMEISFFNEKKEELFTKNIYK